MPAVPLLAASLLAGPAAANPSRSGGGTSSVVVGGSEPSLLLPLLMLAGVVVVVIAGAQWWRHLGGWSPAEMTLALQVTGGDVEALGQRVRLLSPDSPAAQAHRRAALLLPSVLRRSELTAVQAALADARAALVHTDAGRSVESV